MPEEWPGRPQGTPESMTCGPREQRPSHPRPVPEAGGCDLHFCLGMERPPHSALPMHFPFLPDLIQVFTFIIGSQQC